MALMPPMIARKKEVRQKFDPDTWRIFGEVADVRRDRILQSRGLPSNRFHKMPEIIATSVTLPSEIAKYGLRNSEIDYRKNRPHPTGCNFLRENARLINEPICSVHTLSPIGGAHSGRSDHAWWPNYRAKPEQARAPHTLDTIARKDFQYDVNLAPTKSTRHSANTGFQRALGIVPINKLPERDGRQRFFKERMSYENTYDSRTKSNYPIRAKRHGAYVYERIQPLTAQQYLRHSGFKHMQPGWAPTPDFTTSEPSLPPEVTSTQE